MQLFKYPIHNSVFLFCLGWSFNLLIHCCTLIFSTTDVWRRLKDFEHMLSVHSREQRDVLQEKASLWRWFFFFLCWIAWPHHLRDDIRAAGRPHKFEQGRSQERCGVLFHYYAAYPWEEHTSKGQMCVWWWGAWGGAGGGCVSFLHFQNVAVYNLSNDPHLQLVGGEDDWCSGH